MLRSYTRAINKKYGWSGSVFRNDTKAPCLNSNEQSDVVYYKVDGVTILRGERSLELQYPNICFNYILQNPVQSNLVKRAEEWEFSSYADTVGLRDGKLINLERINEYGLHLNTHLGGDLESPPK